MRSCKQTRNGQKKELTKNENIKGSVLAVGFEASATVIFHQE